MRLEGKNVCIASRLKVTQFGRADEAQFTVTISVH